MYVTLTIMVVISFLSLTNACVQFDFSGDVDILDTIQILATYPGPVKELYGVCSRSCSRDVRCNAFDICEGKQLCRTIRGWTPLTPGNVSAGVCQRLQMMYQGGDFFDRQNGVCASHYYCDFENDRSRHVFSLRVWRVTFKLIGQDTQWVHGATGSVGTGPTSAACGSHYKYIETSTNMLGEKAILESVQTFQDRNYCLTMYYHMYGDTTNTLTVRTQKGSNAAIDRWQRAGDHGNAWYRLSGLSLALDPETKILIEATKGSSFTGDIAIDYVELWPFACP